MHELPITQGILDVVLDCVRREGGGRVTGIHLVLGRLSSVVDDSVQFYWDIISEGTAAAGAVLHFRRVPLQFDCLDCGALFAPDGQDYVCPRCRSTRVAVAAGDDMRVEFIDLDDSASADP